MGSRRDHLDNIVGEPGFWILSRGEGQLRVIATAGSEFSPPGKPCTGGLLFRGEAAKATEVLPTSEVAVDFCDSRIPILKIISCLQIGIFYKNCSWKWLLCCAKFPRLTVHQETVIELGSHFGRNISGA